MLSAVQPALLDAIVVQSPGNCIRAERACWAQLMREQLSRADVPRQLLLRPRSRFSAVVLASEQPFSRDGLLDLHYTTHRPPWVISDILSATAETSNPKNERSLSSTHSKTSYFSLASTTRDVESIIVKRYFVPNIILHCYVNKKKN